MAIKDSKGNVITDILFFIMCSFAFTKILLFIITKTFGVDMPPVVEPYNEVHIETVN